ncbi:hypothetical protein [Desulfoplanes sp.]
MENGFAGRVKMGEVAGKYDIPWAEWMTISGFVFHKDYRMSDFPRTPEGKVWYDMPDDDYFSWLADYLPGNIPDLTPEQQKFRDDPKGDNYLSGFWIGDMGASYDREIARYPIFDFPEDFDETCDFSAVRESDAAMIDYDGYLEWASYGDPEDPVMTRNEFILESYGIQQMWIKNQKDFARYWPEFGKFDSLNVLFMVSGFSSEPPDAGWRTLLGMALENIPDKNKRIAELEQFYRIWHEDVTK